MGRATISTHVLDTSAGAPVASVHVRLSRDDDSIVADAMTDGDGRIRDLVAGGVDAGCYRLTFELAGPFFRTVELSVELHDGHYHVPLLVSPFGVSSYRGS